MFRVSDTRLSSESKTKFYKNNINKFVRYFENKEHYNSLIEAGKFEVIEQVIKQNSNFDYNNWIKNILL